MTVKVASLTRSESRLVRVLDEYLAALQRGDAPDRSALLAEYPDLADDLETCLASLDFIRQAEDVSGGQPLAADLPARQLGDFRLLREAGRGGMGVVYEAEQVTLGRRVALKVLPFAAALDPRHLARFRIEAQAAAQLHHTNIVPIFLVGTEQGVHYYAMQFIDGLSLAEVIQGLRHARDPSEPAVRRETPAPIPLGDATAGRPYFEAVARLGVQAAEALDYAHSLGIIHRDVKPANLLLDARGTLWVTDFGLARIQDDAGLTLTGDVLGTLRYMSPEQALARRVLIDERTDVYSLGVTLYELLTLRPAFDGTDRQELLRQIAFEEPPAPRRIDPALPRELETVILKAMSKELESRYATVRELGDDLRRLLEHRPIKARRPTLAERLARLGRRHPSAVFSGFVGMSLVALTLGISTGWIAHERLKAEEARRRADAMAGMVLQGITDPLKRLGNPDLGSDPHLAEMRRQAVADAAFAYENYIVSRTDDLDGRCEASQGLIHLGLVHVVAGERDRAREAYRRAVEVADAATRQWPAHGGVWDNAGQAHITLAMEDWHQGRRSEAEAGFRAADAAFARAIRLAPDNVFVVAHAAGLLLSCPDPRFRDVAQGLALARRLVDLATPRGMDRPRLSGGVRPLFTLGLARYRAGELVAARAALEQSMGHRGGGDAFEWFLMAMIEAREGHPDAARAYYGKAVDWWKWNRYGDVDLHFFEAEAAGLLAAGRAAAALPDPVGGPGP